jgi:hypothetical protein
MAHLTAPALLPAGHCIGVADENRTGAEAEPDGTDEASQPADGAPAVSVAAGRWAAAMASTGSAAPARPTTIAMAVALMAPMGSR